MSATIPPLRHGDRLTRDKFDRRFEAVPDVGHGSVRCLADDLASQVLRVLATIAGDETISPDY
jgi:hypothetical protein